MVIDPANLAQNTAIFIKEAAILANNIEQLKIMIDNFEKGEGKWEQILPFLERLEEVINRGQAMSFGREDISDLFRDRYPGMEVHSDTWIPRNEEITDTQLDTLAGTLQSVNLQYENYRREMPFVLSILEDSNNAIGHMQALQYGNALTAAVVKQIVKLRELSMAQINAQNVYYGGEVARRAEADAKMHEWASAAPRTLEPLSRNDPRGVGSFSFLKVR